MKALAFFVAALALWRGAGPATAGDPPAELYYDQFDWGVLGGDPGHLNTGFWDGPRDQFRYDPARQLGATRGAARLGNGGTFFAQLATARPAALAPTREFDLYARLVLTDFAETDGAPGEANERNAEVAFRSDGSTGYLLTLDGGQDLIRLRRQGDDYGDLIPPVAHPIAPGDAFFLHVRATGVTSETTVIRARVAADASFAGGALLLDAELAGSDWAPQGDRLALIGFCRVGGYTFDADYVALGEPGFDHPPAAWERSGFTDAPPAPAAVRAGDLERHEIDADGALRLYSGPVVVRVAPRLPGVARVDVAPDGDLDAFPSWGVARTSWPALAPELADDGTTLRFAWEDIAVEVEKAPLRLLFRDGDGDVRIAEHPDARPLALGALRSVGFTLAPGEPLYGLGGHSANRSLGLDRRGTTFSLRNVHEPPSSLLFASWVARDGTALFLDNPGFATLDLGDARDDLAFYQSDAGALSYYVLLGDDMKQALARRAALTGPPALAPRWTLGNIQSKFGYRSFDEVDAIADEFDARDIPLEGIILDLYWFGQATMGNLDFEATAAWAEPAARLAALRGRGLHVVPITEPQVTGLSANAADVLALGLVGREPDGASPYALWSLGWITDQAPVYLLDFTREATRAWWSARHQKLITTYAFDGFWQDLNEPEGMPADMRFAAGDAPAVGNVQALLMNRTLDDALALHRPGARPFLMSRSGYAGMERHGASVWSGDVSASFTHLRRQPAIALNVGMAGIPLWNSDIGGFIGTPSPELYLRWCQFGLFNPIYRPHGGQSDREPWRFGPEVEAAVRDLLLLRARLVPHFYTVARASFDDGLPILRPLVLEWPGDATVHNLASSFLYGDRLLARPITRAGAAQETFYLPAATWYEWFGGARVEGPTTLTRDVAPDTILLYARAPSIVPLGPELRRLGATPPGTVTLRVFPDVAHAAMRGSLYEDDGVSRAYREGAFARTSFEGRWRPDGALEVAIGAAAGTYDGAPATRRWEVEVFGLGKAPEAVTHAGVPLAAAAGAAEYAAAEAAWWWDATRGVALAKAGPVATATAHAFVLGPLPRAPSGVRMR